MPTATRPATGFSQLMGELRLVALPRSARHARAFVRYTLAAWQLDQPRELTETAELVTSELIAHAVQSRVIEPSGQRSRVNRPGGTPSLVVVRLHILNHRLRVEVWDSNPTPPAIRGPHYDWRRLPTMFVVGSVSRAWDHYFPASGGKAIWAELPVPHALPLQDEDD